MSPGQTGFVPETKWVCPRDKPRFSSYITQRKPSLSLGQTQFVPGTNPVCPWDKPGDEGRADRVYVLKVYVPFSFPNHGRSGKIMPLESMPENAKGGSKTYLYPRKVQIVLRIPLPKGPKPEEIASNGGHLK